MGPNCGVLLYSGFLWVKGVEDLDSFVTWHCSPTRPSNLTVQSRIRFSKRHQVQVASHQKLFPHCFYAREGFFSFHSIYNPFVIFSNVRWYDKILYFNMRLSSQVPYDKKAGASHAFNCYRTTDISSALQIGRPMVYGLAAKGEYGVRRVIEMLRDELELTMALTGCSSLKDITRSHVRTDRDRLRSLLWSFNKIIAVIS